DVADVVGRGLGPRGRVGEEDGRRGAHGAQRRWPPTEEGSAHQRFCPTHLVSSHSDEGFARATVERAIESGPICGDEAVAQRAVRAAPWTLSPGPAPRRRPASRSPDGAE